MFIKLLSGIASRGLATVLLTSIAPTHILANESGASDSLIASPATASDYLLFSKVDLEKIKARWQESKYKALRSELEASVKRLSNFLEVDAVKEADKAVNKVHTQWNSVETWLRDTAFVAKCGDDPEALRVALNTVDFLREAFPPQDRKDQSGWGSQDLALAYDLLRNDMSDDQKDSFAQIMGRHLGEKTWAMMKAEWFAFGPNASTRPVGGANWMALFSSNLGLTLLALKDTGYWNEEAFVDCLKLADSYINEAIAADGSMYEGMEYAVGFGTHHLPAFLVAARRLGYKINDGNLEKMPEWVLSETLPWGYEAFDHNKSHGRIVPGPLAVYAASRFGNPASLEFLEQSSMGESFGQNYAFAGLVYGLPDQAPFTAFEKPNSVWFSEAGISIWRSGSDSQATMVLTRTYPVGAGHTHADQGAFLIASHGTYWAADNGLRNYDSESHNIVLVSGVGQKKLESRVESFVRSVTDVPAAQMVDIDLRLSYSRYLGGELGGPFAFMPHNPVEFSERQIVSILGASGTIILVRDHMKKDADQREYDWLFHTLGTNCVTTLRRGFKITPGFAGHYFSTLEKGKELKVTLPSEAKGNRLWLLVRTPPSPATGGANFVKINGQRLPGSSIPIARGFHREGWRWLEIQMPQSAKLESNKGPTEIAVVSEKGIEWAAVAVSSAADWSPSYDPAEAGGGVFRLDELKTEAGEGWERKLSSEVLFAVDFLGNQPRSVRLEPSKSVALPELPPRQKISARFVESTLDTLAIMRVNDAKNASTLDHVAGTDRSAAVVTSPSGSDFIILGSQQVDDPKVDFDGNFAVVSRNLKGEVTGFAAHRAVTLRFQGQTLLRSETPVDVLNVSGHISLFSPKTAKADVARLGASKAKVNSQTQNIDNLEIVSLEAKFASETWQSLVSEDGFHVEFFGFADGSPSAYAPNARRVLVNGVPRYFFRDFSGHVFPSLKDGAIVYQDAEIAKDAKNTMGSEKWLVFGPQTALDVKGDDVPSCNEAVNRAFSHDPQLISQASSIEQLLSKLSGSSFNLVPAATGEKVTGTVNFLEPLGVKRGQLCYAVTELLNTTSSPVDVKIVLTTDYWAKLFINGEPIKANDRPIKHLDGADFKADGVSVASMTLRPGSNLLLVKNIGGGASNSFSSWLVAPEVIKMRRPDVPKVGYLRHRPTGKPELYRPQGELGLLSLFKNSDD